MGEPYLYLTTTGWKSGQPHEIEIWFVQHQGRYYLVSERREQAHWVRNIRHNPAVRFRVADAFFSGTGRVVEADAEPELAAAVCRLMDDKYAGVPSSHFVIFWRTTTTILACVMYGMRLICARRFRICITTESENLT